MASYRIVLRKSAAKEIEKLDKKNISRVMGKIQALSVDPRPPGCKKLTGEEKYRIRAGAYRILYQIVDHELIVTIVRVRHRRDAYRK